MAYCMWKYWSALSIRVQPLKQSTQQGSSWNTQQGSSWNTQDLIGRYDVLYHLKILELHDVHLVLCVQGPVSVCVCVTMHS